MKNLFILTVLMFTFSAFAEQIKDDGKQDVRNATKYIQQQKLCVSSVTPYSQSGKFCESSAQKNCSIFGGVMGDSRNVYVNYGCILTINTKFPSGKTGPQYTVESFADDTQECGLFANYEISPDVVDQVNHYFETAHAAVMKLAGEKPCR